MPRIKLVRNVENVQQACCLQKQKVKIMQQSVMSLAAVGRNKSLLSSWSQSQLVARSPSANSLKANTVQSN